MYTEPDDDPVDGRAKTSWITMTSKSPFEVKDAKELPKNNGRGKLVAWRKRVGNYLYSRCSDMRALLKWVDQQKEPVTDTALSLLKPMMPELNHDPVALSFHLYGWLQYSLTESALELYDTLDEVGGLEVWRRIGAEVTHKTVAERMALHDQVLSPARPSDISQVPPGPRPLGRTAPRVR